MHIALWSPAWPLEKFHNGIVTYVHWVRLELERLGHRVSVFTATHAESAVADPHLHFVARGSFGRTLRRFARPLFPLDADVLNWGRVIGDAIRDVHRRDPIDVIEMEESFGWFDDVASRTSIPLLVKLHGPAFLSLIDDELVAPLGRARVQREGEALARASAVASPCAITLAQTVARYGLAPTIGEHLVNPLTMATDTPVWRADSADPDTLLFVGRFDRRKGGDLAVQAFAALAATRPRLRLVFVGPDAGLLQPDGSRVHFEAFCATLPGPCLRSRIDYKGALPNTAIPALRAAVAATIVASRWENQGYAALEAMYQGCPVVSSDAGGGPEIVRHGQTGLLARSDDVADFALQIARLLDDRAGAATMGAAARGYVLERHGTARVAAESLALYRRVIAQHRAAAPHREVIA